ncbi:MAG: hypothetical protein A2064_01925 [Spirochaetes bacterium GWB1_66_5]|nr:MAG: hypothetical protein A2064_01925 [Spirochaetes bacterium GWB1_66_5]
MQEMQQDFFFPRRHAPDVQIVKGQDVDTLIESVQKGVFSHPPRFAAQFVGQRAPACEVHRGQTPRGVFAKSLG